MIDLIGLMVVFSTFLGVFWFTSKRMSYVVKVLPVLFMPVFLSACGEPKQQLTSSEGTPEQVIQSATGKTPIEARIVDSTKYMSIVFQTESMYTRGHLLDVKRAMRVVLDEYPEVDNFFFGWKHIDQPSQYYMKLNFSRSRVGEGDWLNVMVDDIPNYADQYWLIPALR